MHECFRMAKPLAKHIKEPSLIGGEIEQEALAEEARLRAEWQARQAKAKSESGEVSRSESPQNADSPQDTGSPQNAAEVAAASDEDSD
ncbi:V-type ATP synthase subunit H family protein [Oesophagostomum dentatum]|uniref:V-type ATP synthase subunit H family protein n=1 Tax=Oesophagostomum dentatum TaxID=61180 RepID=A0A0B1S4A9_OESDE|nr:V-type ATP synthase subunit H family protein [Oesophagostomum dentatum]